jgi:hypothetical protein
MTHLDALAMAWDTTSDLEACRVLRELYNRAAGRTVSSDEFLDHVNRLVVPK